MGAAPVRGRAALAMGHVEWRDGRGASGKGALPARAAGSRGRGCGWRAGCAAVAAAGPRGAGRRGGVPCGGGGRPYGAGEEGWWRPFPVEYKRGRPKPARCDEVQLCALALCLEEMFEAPVAAGALFYRTPRRRTEVPFDAVLRAETERLAVRMHEMYRARATPRAVYLPKCSYTFQNTCTPISAIRMTGNNRAVTGVSGPDNALIRP